MVFSGRQTGNWGQCIPRLACEHRRLQDHRLFWERSRQRLQERTAGINAFTNPFPGESGARNQVRGVGFFNVDLGLAKRLRMPWSEKQSLQLRWEVFNVTNRTASTCSPFIAPELDISSTFGNYTGLLTNPRVMQFALNFEF
jgi:hypothetical protein